MLDYDRTRDGRRFTDTIKGEHFRVAWGFTKDRRYDLLIDKGGRVRYKRYTYDWGDEIIAKYEEI